jgi:hypothetical protein
VSIRRLILQNKVVGSAPSSPTKSKSPLDHLLAGWIPINQKAVRLLQQRIRDGEFTSNRSVLIEEIKKDIGLLSYLFKYASEEEVFVDNPLKLLEAAPLTELDKIMSHMDELIHCGAFTSALKPQSLRLRHSLISSATAEALALKEGVDPGLAFSVAVIRQLGLALVAWNYPRIYAKALQNVAETGEDIEIVLHRGLGFSPRQIASQITLNNPSPDLRMALGLIQTDIEQPALGKKLSNITTLSEAFAEMNDPEHYPLVTRKWKSITQKLTDILGPKGLSSLQTKIFSLSENYAELPYLGLEADFSIEKNLEIANRKFAEYQFSQNSAATKVSEDIQQRLLRVYSLVRPNEISPEALQILVLDCIPASGFKRGCIFLTNLQNELVPRLRIGERTLDEYRSIPSTSMSSTDNPILEALQSQVPIKRDGNVMFGERVSSVSGIIGNHEKSGVLYLELDDELTKIGGFEPVQRFKAIRLCLNQCLNLKNGNYV